MSWMELVSVYFKKLDVQTQQAWDSWEDSLSPVVWEGCSACVLIRAGDALGKKGRMHFPMLTKVWRGSDAYTDGHFGQPLWLRPHEVLMLLDEFERLRRVCKREEYIDKRDGQWVSESWRKWCLAEPDEWEAELDWVERILWRSVEEDYWIKIELT